MRVDSRQLQWWVMANEVSLSQVEDGPATPSPQRSNHTNPQPVAQVELQMRDALLLWLKWNAAYEQATERLFEAADSPEKLEDVMDWLEQMRREAIKASRDLLDA